MTIKSIQKVIKVGSSLAVTIPARDAKAAGIIAGSEVETTIKRLQTQAATVDQTYEVFKKQYAQTLKNLSQR